MLRPPFFLHQPCFVQLVFLVAFEKQTVGSFLSQHDPSRCNVPMILNLVDRFFFDRDETGRCPSLSFFGAVAGVAVWLVIHVSTSS